MQGLQQVQINQMTDLGMQNTSGNVDIVCESLLESLSILDKCLAFNNVAILLRETWDEQGATNLPEEWAPQVQDPATLESLFKIITVEIRSQSSTLIKTRAAQCLALISNDVGVFPTEEARNTFVGNLMTEIIKLFQSPALHGVIFKEAKLYRELSEMLIRFQNSFGIRDLMRTGDALFE